MTTDFEEYEDPRAGEPDTEAYPAPDVSEVNEPRAKVTKTKELLSDTEKDYGESIKRLSMLMAHTANELIKIGENMPQFSASNSDVLGKYLDNVQSARRNYFDDAMYEGIMDRENGDWRQVIEHGGQRLVMGRPASPSNNGVLTGDNAVIQAAQALGQGTRLTFALWRSGFWITLKPPSDARLSETERMLSQAKVSLGRDTYGNIFSNNMVYTVRILLDLLLDHVYHTSVRVTSNEELLGLIRITDLGHLVTGFANTIYPKTYPYAHSCVNDPSKCNHVEYKDAHIPNMIWHDYSMLSKEQLDFMVNRSERRTVAEVLKYQEMHAVATKDVVKLNDSFSIVLAEPSILDFVNAGNQWIDSIVQTADRVLEKDTSPMQRRQFIAEQATLRDLGQWQHWIKRVIIRTTNEQGEDTDAIVEDRKTIYEIAQNVLSSDDVIRKKVTDEAIRVAENTTITVIGHLRSPCPKCNATPEGHTKYESLVAINPVTVFFVLLDQKLSSIAQTTLTQNS